MRPKPYLIHHPNSVSSALTAYTAEYSRIRSDGVSGRDRHLTLYLGHTDAHAAGRLRSRGRRNRVNDNFEKLLARDDYMKTVPDKEIAYFGS